MNRKDRRSAASGRPTADTVTIDADDAGGAAKGKTVRLSVDDALKLAVEHQEAGRGLPAARIYRAILAEKPDNVDALNNLGILLLHTGETEEAMWLFRAALEHQPKAVEILSNLGIALGDLGRQEEAIAAYRAAVEADPRNPGAVYNFATVLRRFGRLDEALAGFRKAIRLNPNNPAYWPGLAECLSQATITEADPELRQDIEKCLAVRFVEPQLIWRTAASYLKNEPAIADLVQKARGGAIEEAIRADIAAAIDTLSDPILLSLMQVEPIRDGDFETILTAIRRALLTVIREGGMAGIDADRFLTFTAALARQCYLTEYVYAEDDEESDYADLLAAGVGANVATDKPTDPGTLALSACYRPLGELPFDDKLTLPGNLSKDPRIAGLVEQQVAAPRWEREVIEQIPAMKPIDDPTSRAVRAQYEANPYPRWERIGLNVPQPMPAVLTRIFPHLNGRKDLTWPQSPRIMIAGCGTGKQAIAAAMRFRNARVMGFDLSLASLAFALRKAEEWPRLAVSFVQGDIMNLPEPPHPYEIIEAYGVLHHLSDPLEGWRRLLPWLAPGGFMRIALYSRAARAPVNAARDLIGANDWQPTADGIRAAREALKALHAEHPARPVLDEGSDFYTMSSCRDLLFHVQENQIEWGNVKDWIGTLGLEFLGFEFISATTLPRYRERFPDDPHGLDLENWATFEEEHPETFRSTDPFWVRLPA